jgi:hypothetical protein
VHHQASFEKGAHGFRKVVWQPDRLWIIKSKKRVKVASLVIDEGFAPRSRTWESTELFLFSFENHLKGRHKARLPGPP